MAGIWQAIRMRRQIRQQPGHVREFGATALGPLSVVRKTRGGAAA